MDPYPWTWELPALVVCGVGVVLVLGAQVGRSMANFLAGGGWAFGVAAWAHTLPGVLSGRAGAGLAAMTHPGGGGLLWTCVGLVEAALMLGLVLAVRAGLASWGPRRVRGMATRGEAERLVGVSRLRRHAKVIRPDLSAGRGTR